MHRTNLNFYLNLPRNFSFSLRLWSCQGMVQSCKASPSKHLGVALATPKCYPNMCITFPARLLSETTEYMIFGVHVYKCRNECITPLAAMWPGVRTLASLRMGNRDILWKLKVWEHNWMTANSPTPQAVCKHNWKHAALSHHNVTTKRRDRRKIKQKPSLPIAIESCTYYLPGSLPAFKIWENHHTLLSVTLGTDEQDQISTPAHRGSCMKRNSTSENFKQ